MSRLIPYAGASRGGAGVGAPANVNQSPSAQDRLEAVAKYVPSEILAFYVPAVSAIEMLDESRQYAFHVVVSIVTWILVPGYFKWIAGSDPRVTRQAVVSTIAFPIWVYATNRDIGVMGMWFEEPIALLALLSFTLFTAFFVPKRS